MACTCHRGKGPDVVVSDSEFTKEYDTTYENAGNVSYQANYDNKQAEDDVSSRDRSTSNEMMFVDGNDGDLEACEYEETLMDRVWLACKPPTIPRHTCVVPARRFQISKERLSPTLNDWPAVREAASTSLKKKGRGRRRMKSDVKYVSVNDFKDEKHVSCLTQTVTVVPSCARKLEHLL